MKPIAEIEVYVRRLRVSGATLVVVQVDREWTHGAADADPTLALLLAARKASEAVARCGRNVPIAAIVARGRATLQLTGRRTASSDDAPTAVAEASTFVS